MYTNCEKYNIFNEGQNDFRKKLSTVLEVYRIFDVFSNKTTVVLLLDKQ